MTNRNILITVMGDSQEEREQLAVFLYKINDNFHNHLTSKVNIFDYVSKVLTNGIVVVAKSDQQIVGAFLGYANDFNTKKAYVSTLGVLEDYRSSGIGKKMLLTMKEICRTYGMKWMCLYTHHTNEHAIRFYTQNGFAVAADPIDRHEDFYLVCSLENYPENYKEP